MAIEIHRVVAPFASRDHPPVKIEYPLQFGAFEADLLGAAAGKGHHLSGGKAGCG